MNQREILGHYDDGRLWPHAPSQDAAFGMEQAYRDALAVRELRAARGETPHGFKIGFTNRNIWQRYGVDGPIWATVYDSSLSFCDGQGSVSLKASCQPRLEPEVVFGMKATPPANASLEDDALPVFPGEQWTGDFVAPLSRLQIVFS